MFYCNFVYTNTFYCRTLNKLFLIVGLRAEDSDFTSFLWFGDSIAENKIVTVFRFFRVVFRLICSPFILNATIKVYCKKYLNVGQNFISEFLRNLHVDSFTLGFDSFNDGYEHFSKARKIMSKAGFELRRCMMKLKKLF